MLKKLSFLFLMFLLPFTAMADHGNEHAYAYPLKNIEIIDGDTIEADILLGFDLTKRSRIRIKGYDAPETFRPKSEEEKMRGLAAKKYLTEILVGTPIIIVSGKYKDSFGRVLGYIQLEDGNSVTNLMIENRHIK